jgi:hypothetical protein
VGQLKSALYARMEEVSFRAGAAVAGGVLTAAGVAIALAVVPSGHRDAAAIASARVAAPSLAPPPVAPVSSVPSPTPRPSRTTTRATAAGTYQPPSTARASAARQAAATSALGRTPTARLREARYPRRPGMPPGYWRSHRPRPWLSGLLWHHRLWHHRRR